jgi:peptidoglycan hydrolase CwlO-like protein
MIPSDKRDPFTDPSVQLERHARALESEITALRAEVAEQARLNGMGSEREARLLAEVAALKAGKEKAVDEALERAALCSDSMRVDGNLAGDGSFIALAIRSMKSKGAE